jgi:hypothetical protein
VDTKRTLIKVTNLGRRTKVREASTGKIMDENRFKREHS